MGDSGQVLIEDIGVYLYTHWKASELPEIIHRAISRKQRWNHPEYLARIIFSEMTKGEEDKETGFGIGTIEDHYSWRLVKVNCKEQWITIVDRDKPFFGRFEDFANNFEQMKSTLEKLEKLKSTADVQ